MGYISSNLEILSGNVFCSLTAKYSSHQLLVKSTLNFVTQKLLQCLFVPDKWVFVKRWQFWQCFLIKSANSFCKVHVLILMRISLTARRNFVVFIFWMQMSRFVEHEQHGLFVCQYHWDQEWQIGEDVQEWADVKWIFKPGSCHLLQHHALVLFAQKLDIAETFVGCALQRQSICDLIKDLVQIALL